MKAAIISPIAMLSNYSALSHFHLALAHLVLDDPVYRRFYEEMSARSDYIIVDNSVTELGEARNIALVVEAARLVGAHELVLPDVFGDATATVFSTLRALQHLDRKYPHHGWKLCAVPHGKTPEEWIQCYTTLCKLDDVVVIGIPKVVETYGMEGGREAMLAAMQTLGLVRKNKEYHLLGVWSDPLEVLRIAQRFPWVRSVDSCIPVLAGLHGVPFPDPLLNTQFERPAEKLDFNAIEDPHPEITRFNCKQFLYWASGKTL